MLFTPLTLDRGSVRNALIDGLVCVTGNKLHTREGNRKIELCLNMAEVHDEDAASMAELDSGTGRPWRRYTVAPPHVIIG